MLTIGEAARRLRVSPKTLRAWCDRRLVSYTRLPCGYRRFSVDQIEQIGHSMLFTAKRTDRAYQTSSRTDQIRAGDEAIPPLVARLNALRAELMQGRHSDVSSAQLINQAREERLAEL